VGGDASDDAAMNDDDVCSSTVDTAAAASSSRRRLFSLQIVNSYGSTDVDRLVDDGKAFNFDGEYNIYTVDVFCSLASTWPHLNSDVGLEEGEY